MDGFCRSDIWFYNLFMHGLLKCLNVSFIIILFKIK